ncbi:MAG: hypothetical protein L6R42_011091 [Xanthoria sp. 1 TBL-2021]|nr:MAG: hypothetical protein L6R42_011091 [Xanthoria sp. 1 TBL-2021]
MTSAQDNDELARLDPQKHRDDDVATQRAATAKERAHRKNRKRKERIKRNYSERPGGGRIILASDAEQGKDRFMAEWEAALKEQGTSNELVDWWKREPSYQERTGKMSPGKEFWNLVRENGVLAAKSKGLGEPGLDAETAIVLEGRDDDDDGDGDENGGMAVERMEGMEMGSHGGISGDMVLRGPKLSGCEVKGGCRSSSTTLEQVPRGGSEESGADLDAEGGVRF